LLNNSILNQRENQGNYFKYSGFYNQLVVCEDLFITLFNNNLPASGSTLAEKWLSFIENEDFLNWNNLQQIVKDTLVKNNE